MVKRKELEPLIPLEDLKQFVAAIARVPKEAVDKAIGAAEPDSDPQPKRRRKPAP